MVRVRSPHPNVNFALNLSLANWGMILADGAPPVRSPAPASPGYDPTTVGVLLVGLAVIVGGIWFNHRASSKADPLRSSAPRLTNQATGGSLLLVVLCSIVISVATTVVLIHFSLLPGVAVPPHSASPVVRGRKKLPADPAKTLVEKSSNADPTRQQPTPSTTVHDASTDPLALTPDAPNQSQVPGVGGVLVNPSNVAVISLEIIRDVYVDSSYVSPSKHVTLFNDLNNLEQAANAVANDDGSNPAASAKRAAALSKAVDAAIKTTAAIISRDTETPEAVATTQKLQDLLVGLKN